MSINERFKVIINSMFNGNNALFAKSIGVSPTVIQNVVGTRGGKPSFDVIAKTCAIENISSDWVVLGIGDMITNDASAKTPTSDDTTVTALGNIISRQGEEIGRLKERIRQLEEDIKKYSDADARAGVIA